MTALPLSLLPAAGGLMLVAAWIDVRSLRIPDWIPALLVLLFILAQPVSGLGWQRFAWSHLGAGLIVLIGGLAPFALNLLGGGDVKLLTAAAVGLGTPLLIPGLVAISIAGLLLSLVLLALRRSGLPRWLDARGYACLGLEKGRGVPYGVAIAAGFLWVAYPAL